MPRRPRLHIPGVPQHVIQRGVDRQPIFFADEDCHFYLDWLREYAHKREVALHAYCLMTNHVHLLLTSPSGRALAGLMQDMGRRYVQYINRTYRRSGGLWQGRYKACFVQIERYLLSCMRYVELNPVLAAMAKTPDAYRWSSYNANAQGAPDSIVTPHVVYRALGTTDEARQQAYRTLFTGEGDDWDLIRTATQQGVVAGDSRFVSAIEQRLDRSVRPRPRGRPTKGEDT